MSDPLYAVIPRGDRLDLTYEKPKPVAYFCYRKHAEKWGAQMYGVYCDVVPVSEPVATEG